METTNIQDGRYKVEFTFGEETIKGIGIFTENGFYMKSCETYEGSFLIDDITIKSLKKIGNFNPKNWTYGNHTYKRIKG